MYIAYIPVLFGLNAQEEEKKTHSTKNIDITVKDKDGYNHFLVFTKVATPDKSYVAYNVEFWVNNYVYSNTDEFSQITFKAGKKVSTETFISPMFPRTLLFFISIWTKLRSKDFLETPVLRIS